MATFLASKAPTLVGGTNPHKHPRNVSGGNVVRLCPCCDTISVGGVA